MGDEGSSAQADRKRVEHVTGSASSVWSLCDDSVDHVDLRDITPSISPVVFTDDQVRQITQQNSEIDVLNTPFLPPETFKRMNEVLTTADHSHAALQLMTCTSPLIVHDAISYTAAELGSGFHHDHSPLKRDVLLHDAEDLKLDLFPGLIDELGEQRISRQTLDTTPGTDKVQGRGRSPGDCKEGGEGDDKKEELAKSKGKTHNLRRSPRKQPQQVKIEATKKVDIKCGNTKASATGTDAKSPSDNAAEPATRRRSPRTKLEQSKVEEKGNNKKKAVSSHVGTAKGEEKGENKQEAGLKPEEVSRNVRRSPRIQKKPEKEENNKDTSNVGPKTGRGGRKEGIQATEDNVSSESTNEVEKREEHSLSDKSTADLEKEGEKGVRHEESNIKEEETKIKQRVEERSNQGVVKSSEKVMKGQKDKGEEDGGDGSKERAQRGRRSHIAVHKQKAEEEEVKEEETQKKDVSSTAEETLDKKKDNLIGKGGREETFSDKEDSKRRESTESNKSNNVALEKVSSSKLQPASDDDNKKLREHKEPKVKEETQQEIMKTSKRKDWKGEGQARKEREKEKEMEEREEELKSKRIRKATEKGREYFQEGKREITESEQEDQEPVQEEEVKEEEEEEGSESSESDADEGDSDYDPENDPERLWCICRKPHGNRFMICCDSCEMWFHGDCVGISMSQGRQMEKVGKDYVCPKCKAAREKDSRHKPDSGRHKEEVPHEKDRGYPEKQQRRHRRLKLPTDPTIERRKSHKHSAKEHRRREVSVESFYKPEDGKGKVQNREEGKRKSQESAGFKIPKKVRTTPTPVSYKMNQSHQNCILIGCGNLALVNSLYCSDECIRRHADESLRVLHAEKQKQLGNKSQLSKSTAPPSANLSSPLPWETNPPAVVTSSVESHTREGVAVWEKLTGRVIAGVAAPPEEQLVSWLKRHPTFSVLKPTVSKDDKRKEKKDDEKTVRENVKRSLKEILTTRSKEVEMLHLNSDDITKCALTVEEELFKVFSDTGPRYKNKYRSLMFNLKDPRNKVLFRHVLSGEIPSDRLVRMTPEQLASHELASWREREVKHTLEMIKQTQESSKVHVVKKTHKGEVAIDEDEDMSSLETIVKPQTASDEVSDLPDSNTSSSTLLIDTTDEHRVHLFDLNCRICTGKITPPGELPKKDPAISLVSTTTIVQAVAESSIPSPPPTVEVSTVSSPDSVSTASAPYSPSPAVKPAKKVRAAWKGFVMMGGVAKFSTHAYRVSGPCDDLLQLLPDTLHVQGRIAHGQVWDYIFQLKSSTTRDVSLIRYEASSDEEKISYLSLYSYFYSRKRCGVISNCYSGVKDMYVVPLASHQAVPPELLPFDGPGLSDPRPHMLLGVIVRTKAVFKRPRAISQRSTSPPRKRRPSSGSAGSGNESPLRDSPVAEIDDIVFQYHSGQKNKAASGAAVSPAGAGTAGTTPSRRSVLPGAASSDTTPSRTTPSETSSSSIVASPGQAAQAPLHVQKRHLLELQERARHYILSTVQGKDPTPGEGPAEAGLAGKTSEGSEPYDPEVGTEDDVPYDPEEELPLDLDPESGQPKVPAVSQSVSTVMADLLSSVEMSSVNSVGTGAAGTILQPLFASLSSTSGIKQSHAVLPGSTSGLLVQSSRMDAGSAPDSQQSLPPHMQSSWMDAGSAPDSQQSLPPHMQSSRMDAGSAPDSQQSLPPHMQSSRMNTGSAPDSQQSLPLLMQSSRMDAGSAPGPQQLLLPLMQSSRMDAGSVPGPQQSLPSLMQSSRMNTGSAPGPQLSQQLLVQSSQMNAGSTPGPHQSLPSLMQSSRMNTGSAPGSQLSQQLLVQSSQMNAGSAPGPQLSQQHLVQSSQMNAGSAPVRQVPQPGLAPQKDGDSHRKVEGPSFDRPQSQRDGLSQHPTPGESRFVMPEPPDIARTVGNFRQRPPEGPQSNARDSTQPYEDRARMEQRDNRVHPQQTPVGPHQRAPYCNAPATARGPDRERRYHREEPESRCSRDPRARDPGYQDDRWRDRQDSHGPPRSWSEGNRDRDRGRDGEPYGRYDGPYDERGQFEGGRGRYDNFRRDDRRHEEYRRERWRR